MKIKIQKTAESDIPHILTMMREFAEYEGLGEYVETTAERLRIAMFDEKSFVDGLMAFDGDEPVAYALFYPYFASFRGQRGMYLEDIYIKAECRGNNLGERMLREIARIAHSRGFERIDFQVLETNYSAIDFYEKHGAGPRRYGAAFQVYG